MKNKNLRILSNFLTADLNKKVSYFDNYILETDENGIITKFTPANTTQSHPDLIDLTDKIILPGFIDAHTHLPQLPIIGSYGETLINWLNKYTFPAEIHFGEKAYARKLSKLFFDSLKECGTLTAVVYSSIHKESTNIAFEEALKSDLRIFMGKVMMDQNSPEELTESPIQSLQNSLYLKEIWHQYTPKIEYIYSPRFAISTSFGLLQQTAKLAKDSDCFIHTHINENTDEVKSTKEMYPEFEHYLDVYDKAGLLGRKTLLAHGIYSTEAELERIVETKTKVIHCPDANFFLKSGRFPIEKYRYHNIQFGLGSDVGAGTSLNMLDIMKSMIFMQNSIGSQEVTMEEAFYIATLGNAKVLSLEAIIGSIEVGKLAELNVFEGYSNSSQGSKDILASLIFKESLKLTDSIL